MNNGQLRRLAASEKAVEEIISTDGDEVEKVTIYARCTQTYFDADGTRRERMLPAEYDESQPFPPPRRNKETGRLRSMRVLWPIGEDPGPYAPQVNEPSD